MNTNGLKLAMFLAVLALVGCTKSPPAQSVGGVKMASVESLQTDAKGHSVGQVNLLNQLKRDNEPGAIKHLYVISTSSGQVLLYSPVKGQVTSSGRRLTPKTIAGVSPNQNGSQTLPVVNIGGVWYTTTEVANEDGTYGSSNTDYLIWETPSGQFHRHYPTAGAMVHISDQPISVKSVILTIEELKK